MITIPAICKSSAKQFMRLAAYQAGLASEKRSSQLIIALEPEAASLYCRRLKLNQLVNDHATKPDNCLHIEKCFEKGSRYFVVDCGGGTVDITVHEIEDDRKGKLKEIYYGGGPFGSICIDKQFELVLMRIFGQEFIEKYKHQYPSGYVDLMNSFEARKRTATITQNRDALLNITLPFSFINAFKKPIDQYLKRFYSSNRELVDKDEISYCSKLGMIRLQPSFMYKLFQPVTNEIIDHISQIILNEEVNSSDRPLKYLFLVGGFAESQIVQHIVRTTFDSQFSSDKSVCDTDQLGNADKQTIDKSSDEKSIANKSICNKSTGDKCLVNSSQSKSKDGSVFKRSLNKLIKLDSKSIKVNSSQIDKEAQTKKVSLTHQVSDELKKKCESLRVVIPQEVSYQIRSN